jgi:hypothetical protein
MNGADDSRNGAPDARAERAERLAAALRANLKRRKEQARARCAPEAAADQDPAPPAERR